MADKTTKLPGEGDAKIIIRTRERRECEYCDELAVYKHALLLENYRSNPASSAYGRDDCSYSSDDDVFTCGKCKPGIPHGFVEGSRFECGERFSHMFLHWTEEVIETTSAIADERNES